MTDEHRKPLLRALQTQDQTTQDSQSLAPLIQLTTGESSHDDSLADMPNHHYFVRQPEALGGIYRIVQGYRNHNEQNCHDGLALSGFSDDPTGEEIVDPLTTFRTERTGGPGAIGKYVVTESCISRYPVIGVTVHE